MISDDLTHPDFEASLTLEHLHSLLRLTKQLELAYDYAAVLRALGDEIRQVIGYHTTWVYLLGDEPDMAYLLTAQESVGISEQIPTLDMSSDAFLQEIATADHVVIVEDARTDPRTNKAIVEMLGNRSIINVPIHLAGKKIGLIGTGSFGDEGVMLPSAGQINYLSAMASHAAVALDRLRLYQEHQLAEQANIEMQKQVAHVQRLESLGVLAGGIAHDFNNILSAIVGNLELAERVLGKEAPASLFLGRIGVASRKAIELCGQMLTYAGHRASRPEEIDLSQLLCDMASLLAVNIGKQVHVEYELDENLPNILGDVVQIQQVMMNLITNANEAIGDENGVITIRSGCLHADQDDLDRLEYSQNTIPGDYVYFEVSDNGCGMDQATRERLFDPFFTTKFTGRGLGMSAVLGIIQSHLGALTLESVPGEGTTFRVLFPVTEVLQQAPALSGSEDSPSRAAGHTVLVTDDDEVVREMTVSVLNYFGFQGVAAENGKAALDILAGEDGERINLVLLDVMMPGMDGVDTFRAIRKIRDIPIVLVSGYNTSDMLARFDGLQPSGFIQKPFAANDLYVALTGVLQQD
ncbi:response regulator [Mariprofundus erugo]|uniref:hybrid sensor histidine kinase/response regulator n=1 Tax=Mariprofundus erugo TaxID=2528639 RepID=UPI0010FE2D43|nr:response regulator [Mariprofundus erugo]TLS74187.1 response regulator [Mariprofundus erugo]